MEFIRRLYRRGWKYLTVGVSTFFLDIGILFVLVTVTPIPYEISVAAAFLIGISVNYYICYHWVFLGTERKFHHGYFYFISLALLGAAIISGGTMFLVETLHLPLFIARTIMGAATGTLGFFVNGYFNFRML